MLLSLVYFILFKRLHLSGQPNPINLGKKSQHLIIECNFIEHLNCGQAKQIHSESTQRSEVEYKCCRAYLWKHVVIFLRFLSNF